MVPIDKGVVPSAFASGLSRVPVTLKNVDGSTGAVDFLAGFFGVGQRSEDNALVPVISWSVVGSNLK